MNIKRVWKEYYEPFYAPKFDNLDEVNQFLEKAQSAKTHTWIDNLNIPILMIEIESIINKFPKYKGLDLNGFTGKLYQFSGGKWNQVSTVSSREPKHRTYFITDFMRLVFPENKTKDITRKETTDQYLSWI